MLNLNALRPARFRPILTIAIAAPLLLLLWAWFELWVAYTITPTVQRNYGGMLRETAESWQDTSGVNGWDALLEAVHLHEHHVSVYMETDASGAEWDWEPWGYEAITDPDRTRQLVSSLYEHGLAPKEVDAHFERVRGWAIETIDSLESIGVATQLRRLAESGCVLMPIADSKAGESVDIMIQLSNTRSLVRGLQARMHLAREDADWDEYLESYRWIIQIGRSLAYQPGATNTLVANAIVSIALRQVIEDIQLGLLPDDLVNVLAGETDRLPDPEQAKRVIDVDRYMQLDFFQQFFGRGGRMILTEYAKLVPFAEEERWIKNVQGLWKPRWSHYERLVNEYYDEVGRIVALPLHLREPLRPESRTRSLAARLVDPQENEDPLPQFDPTRTFSERFLSPEVAFTLADQELRFTVLTQGFLLFMAIEKYAVRERSYPVSLQNLVPEYIAEVPTDPCSPDAQPWIYRRYEEPDDAGRPYILYSLGFDMQDDGGAPPARHMSNSLSRNNMGTDYVVSHPALPEESDD